MRVDADMVAITSKEPTTFGLAFLTLDAEISSETCVPVSLSEKLLMFIFADLIELDVILLGISARGIDALIPEALGMSRSTRVTICDVMYCWIASDPLKRTKTIKGAAISLIFIRET